MKIYQFLLFSIVTVLFLAGCQTTPQNLPTRGEEEVGKYIEKEPNVIFKKTDDFFEISGSNDGLTSFTVKNPNADIRDLASFSTYLYRDELAPKIQNCEKLTEADFQLLKFCVRTQISAIDAYTWVCLKDMYGDTNSSKPDDNPISKDISETKIDINNLEEQMKEVCYSLQVKFDKSNSRLREDISRWGTPFQCIGREILRTDLSKIQALENEKIDNFQWRQLWHYVPYINFFTILMHGDGDLYETPELRPYQAYSNDPTVTAFQWKALNNAMSIPINELKTMYDDLEAYLANTKDSRSYGKIHDLRLSFDNEMRNAIRDHTYVFTDLPFSVFCKHAYIGIQDCKDPVDDDEEAMKNVVNKYIIRVNGTDMLLRIKSPHTSDIYAQLLELIKSEFGDTGYKNYLLRTKLYEIDDLKDDLFEQNKLKVSAPK